MSLNFDSIYYLGSNTLPVVLISPWLLPEGTTVGNTKGGISILGRGNCTLARLPCSRYDRKNGLSSSSSMRIGMFLDPMEGVLASKSGGELIESMVETEMSSDNKEII